MHDQDRTFQRWTAKRKTQVVVEILKGKLTIAEVSYRRIAVLLQVNRKPVQRVLQRKHWQVNTRPKGHRPRVKATPSLAAFPNQRWSTDLTRAWCGRDGWCHLALVIDCSTRELLGWRLASRGTATTAEAALNDYCSIGGVGNTSSWSLACVPPVGSTGVQVGGLLKLSQVFKGGRINDPSKPALYCLAVSREDVTPPPR